jgi:UPF0271 protein
MREKMMDGPPRTIDLNADLGESFGPWRMGDDEAVLPWVSSANIAAGAHAGDPFTAVHTLRRAKALGVAPGAHPGWPDLAGFGRRPLPFSPDETYAIVLHQLGALQALARGEGLPLHHVKLHGALYHQAAGDRCYADPVVEAIAVVDPALFVYAPDPSVLADQARRRGLRVVAEGFADRRYRADGQLIPRTEPDALIRDLDEACRQVLTLVGHLPGVARPVATIGLHGDGVEAPRLARRVHEALVGAGIVIVPPGAAGE